jgi:hypothetical protein
MMETNELGGSLPGIATLLNDPQIRAEFEARGFDVLGSTSNGDPEAMATAPAAFDPQASIRALYQLKERFEILENRLAGSNLQIPAQRQHAIEMLRSIDIELKAHRGALDPQVYQELATHVVDTEARLHATPAKLILTESGAARPGSRSLRYSGASMPGPASFGGGSELTAAPIRPIPVQPTDGCPAGTQLRSRARGAGEEEWCQQLADDGGLRHGWYAQYHSGGQPESMGEYANGLRIGVWTRFYASGQVRAQAQFVEGMQHGWLLSFDEEGNRTKAVRFDHGVATP